MKNYQKHFIEFILKNDMLRLGDFTLKSGRQSPYFLNMGHIKTGTELATLGRFYADAIMASGIEFEVLFGPAYKGIPLVCTTAIALTQEHQRDVSFAFNRKEVKDHGEGGKIIGAELRGAKVLLIDDVITAGTAVREAADLLDCLEAELVGVLVSFDRQESGQSDLSALEEIAQEYEVPVHSIASLEHLIEYLQNKPAYQEHLDRILEYCA